jgi:DNA-directed RNA polymerase subunit omega
MKLVEGFDSNYRYVLVAARRARQIQNGARPVVEPHSRKPCRIAEEELQAGKVKWEIPPIVAKGADDAVLEVTDHPVGGEADD